MTWDKKNEDDRGRWNEYVNSETGESSIKEHKLKVVWRGCKGGNHVYELTGNRECTCTKCGFIKEFILGQEIFKDGQIVRI
jgi:hypothetical protein